MIKSHNATPKIRDYALDNIKFILIFMVVFGHLLRRCAPFARFEIFPLLLYQYIYTFHMPVFIFMLGYNITHSPKRILFRWLLPYFIFQSLYLAFTQYVLHDEVTWQYANPHWILWYLMSCAFYQLLLPLYNTQSRNKQIIALTITFCLALLVGYHKSISYEFSLSRFFVFQPYFLLGYYCKKNNTISCIMQQRKVRIRINLVAIGALIILIPFLFIAHLPCKLFFHADPYEVFGTTSVVRAALMLFATTWILFFFVTLKPHINKPLPVLTKIGQHTLPIYLLHGFIVELLQTYAPQALQSVWQLLLLTCGILLLLGNSACKKVVYYISGSWIEKYITIRKTKEQV